MKFKNIIIVCFSLTLSLFLIGRIFWEQELQYMLPTPIPGDYTAVAVAQDLKADLALIKTGSKPKHLHFYNPSCPCSRFNLEHFLTLTRRYNKEVDFYMVIPSQEKYVEVKSKYPDIQVLVDGDEKLAKACGVYSTPQAVIVDSVGKLFYRGNYNKSRYCTEPNPNFAQMALDSLINGKSPPALGELSTTSYGCQLNKSDSFFSFL